MNKYCPVNTDLPIDQQIEVIRKCTKEISKSNDFFSCPELNDFINIQYKLINDLEDSLLT